MRESSESILCSRLFVLFEYPIYWMFGLQFFSLKLVPWKFIIIFITVKKNLICRCTFIFLLLRRNRTDAFSVSLLSYLNVAGGLAKGISTLRCACRFLFLPLYIFFLECNFVFVLTTFLLVWRGLVGDVPLCCAAACSAVPVVAGS